VKKARNLARRPKSLARRQKAPVVLPVPERLPFVSLDGETVLTNVPGTAKAMQAWLLKQKPPALTPGLNKPAALEEGKHDE